MDQELRTILIDLSRELLRRLERRPPPNLSPSQRAIVEAITDDPQASRTLARVAGRRFNSSFMEQLRGLVAQGLIRKTARGYSRP